MPRDFTPHQQKIIQRYYDNQGTIQQQRLAELVTELYLADTETKRAAVWKRAATAMKKLGIAASRIEHLVAKNDPALLAGVVKELEGRG